jgi:hypothetical protein
MADNLIKKNSGFLKYAGIFILVVVIFLIYRKYTQTENLYDVPFSKINSEDGTAQAQSEQPQIVMGATGQNVSSVQRDFMGSDITFPVNGKDIVPTDLLPKSAVAGEFDSETSPSSDLSATNYLVTSGNFGLDSTGSSNKNANLQLRSEPHIPVNMNTGPWNQSTITPNMFARNFNIGE